jgi:hypothetical protein
MQKDLHQYVMYKVTRGEHVAMSADHYVGDPMQFAAGMRAALPFKVIEDWGVKIEVRARRHETKADWKKPGILIKKFA